MRNDRDLKFKYMSEMHETVGQIVICCLTSTKRGSATPIDTCWKLKFPNTASRRHWTAGSPFLLMWSLIPMFMYFKVSVNLLGPYDYKWKYRCSIGWTGFQFPVSVQTQNCRVTLIFYTKAQPHGNYNSYAPPRCSAQRKLGLQLQVAWASSIGHTKVVVSGQ